MIDFDSLAAQVSARIKRPVTAGQVAWIVEQSLRGLGCEASDDLCSELSVEQWREEVAAAELAMPTFWNTNYTMERT